MKYNTTTLTNGLRIIHLPSDSDVVYCGYGIKAGSRNELPGEEGLAHFCEHATFKGTKRLKAGHILNGLESVGGGLNAFTNKEITIYHGAVLKDYLNIAVDLLSDIVFHSQYPQAELDKEVEVICDEIESYNDSPAELVFEELENMLFEGHPLGHNILGNANQLRTYTRDNLVRFVDRYYNTSNAVFFAYGQLDFDKLVRRLERLTSDCLCQSRLQDDLGGFPCPCGDVAPEMPPYKPQEKRIDKQTHQAHVVIGNRAYSATDKRRYALTLLDNILGGGTMSSRLNMALRERNALVYTVYSTSMYRTDTGTWVTYFGCDPKDVARCRKLVGRELAKLMDKPLSESQFNRARRQLRGQLGVASDSREYRALTFATLYLKYGIEHDFNKYLAHIDALTPRDLQDVALDLFAPEKLTTLIIQ